MKDLDCLEHLGMQDIQLQWGTLKKKIQNQENTIVNTWIKFTGSFQVVLATKITFFNHLSFYFTFVINQTKKILKNYQCGIHEKFTN
jgi:hypothetical protein